VMLCGPLSETRTLWLLPQGVTNTVAVSHSQSHTKCSCLKGPQNYITQSHPQILSHTFLALCSLMTRDSRMACSCVSHCDAVQHTATRHSAVQHTVALHQKADCESERHSLLLWSCVSHCNTLQHTATHCNKLHFTALQHKVGGHAVRSYVMLLCLSFTHSTLTLEVWSAVMLLRVWVCA